MKASRRTLAVVAIAAATGAVTTVAAVLALIGHPFVDANQLAVFATLTVLVAATWMSPLVMYRGNQSEALNLDEGFFILVALLLPTGAGVAVFALASLASQLLRRRALIKSVFNWGQVVTAAGIGLAAVHWLAPPTAKLTGTELLAAAGGTVIFFLVNCVAMTAIISSLGVPARRALDGMEIRLLVVGSCTAVAMVSTLAVSQYQWALPLAMLPLLILRQVLSGHFQARHDRARLLGLFDAALDANRSLGEDDVLETILGSVRELLRCPNASVRSTPPIGSELGAAMSVHDEPFWLVVSGRSRTEPFDAADRKLLEALAAVGAGALTNGRNYREARFQRERVAAITSSVGEGVCALDRDGQMTFVNPAAARLLGWPDDHSASDQATPDFLLELAQCVIATRNTLRCDDAEFRRHDGAQVPVAYTASAIEDEDEVVGAVIVFHDISERREVENAIRVARDQAIEASQLKSRFLANMSHEIRTPMNGVLGMSKLLLETEVDEEQRQYLLTIRDSGENLMVILNDILDFSKIEAGKLQLEEVDFDLGASMTSVINSMTVAAHDKGLGVQLAIEPEMPRVVRGDPVRIRQVLTNLVSNAIKFTDVGAVTVSARVPASGRVRISVTDTGIGIEPSARARVLDAFSQADGSTTRRYGGTGLGLAICCQLVAMMGGHLDFTSQPGVGSTFWFEVPLPAGQAQESATAAQDSKEPVLDLWSPVPGITTTGLTTAPLPALRPAPVAAPTAAVSSGPVRDGTPAGVPKAGRGPVPDAPRVLVADDNAVNQLVASLRLEKMGYQVDVVRTGVEAVQAVQRRNYLAVLMDCRMPVMDGYEATRQIRALTGSPAATFVIAMTSSAMVGDQEECMVAGMDAYLTKPLDADLLAEALIQATQARQWGATRPTLVG